MDINLHESDKNYAFDRFLRSKQIQLSRSPDYIVKNQICDFIKTKTGLPVEKLELSIKNQCARINAPAIVKQYLLVHQVMIINELRLEKFGIQKFI